METIESSLEKKSTISIININKEYSVYKQTLSIFKNQSLVSTKESQGIEKTKIIKNVFHENELIHTKKRYLILDKKLKHFLLEYGFPSFNEDDIFQNSEGLVSNPAFIFKTLIKENKVSFEVIKDSPESINDIVYFDFDNSFVKFIKSGKIVPMALRVDKVIGSDTYLKSIHNTINELIKQKRLSFKIENLFTDNHDFKIEHIYPNPVELQSLYATSSISQLIDHTWYNFLYKSFVQVTEDEFYQIIKQEKKERIKKTSFNNKLILPDLFYSFESIFHSNLLGISEHFHGWEDKEPFHTLKTK